MTRRKSVPEMDAGEFAALLGQLSKNDLERVVTFLYAYDPYGLEEALTALKLPRETGGDPSRCPARSPFTGSQCIIAPGHDGPHRNTAGAMWDDAGEAGQ